MNSDAIDWVIVRDHKVDLVYYAKISLFSDSGEKRELTLEDVEVYDTSWKLQYHTEKLYICRDDFDLSIELDVESQRKAKSGRRRRG
jgi:hypothetical protein